jgi:autotransporter family porin
MQLATWRAALVALMAAVVLVVVLTTHRTAPGVATPGPVAGNTGATLPVGSRLPSAESCAAYADQVGSDREAEPENTLANRSSPSVRTLPPWPDFWAPPANRLFVPRIDGQFTGTTDQIIVWGACKWGISTDVVRAMAMVESAWRQAHVGDYANDPALCVGDYAAPCPTSFGLLQLKHITRPGSWPDSQLHTAFNVDYSLAVLRGCFEGWVTYLDNGYSASDLWGCVGWHYSGQWKDDLALGYVQAVKHELEERPWTNW